MDASGGMELRSESASIAKLVNTLSNLLGRTVVDETRLTGEFTFQIKFFADDRLMGVPLSRSPADRPTADADLGRRSVFDALKEQLGLTLKLIKGPVEILVIDHVEKPTEN
jgi:uncharacterized protein (TIGR03435 family)